MASRAENRRQGMEIDGHGLILTDANERNVGPKPPPVRFEL